MISEPGSPDLAVDLGEDAMAGSSILIAKKKKRAKGQVSVTDLDTCSWPTEAFGDKLIKRQLMTDSWQRQ